MLSNDSQNNRLQAVSEVSTAAVIMGKSPYSSVEFNESFGEVSLSGLNNKPGKKSARIRQPNTASFVTSVT
jgi:hypothetical protein